MTSTDSSHNSETLTNSSPQSNLPNSPELLENLARVLELFRQRDLLRELFQVLNSEMLWHLRGAVFSSHNDPELQSYHKHVAQWLQQIVEGNALEKYRLQAEMRMDPDKFQQEPQTLMEPDSGSDYLT